jgi:hypothetical protein
LPGLSAPLLQQAAAPVTAVAVPGLNVSTPGIPGGFSPAQYATVPSFSFLDEARSIFASPPAVPVHAVPLPAVSTERLASEPRYGQSPTSLGLDAPPAPTSLPGVGASPIAAPQIAGAPTHTAGFDPGIAGRLVAVAAVAHEPFVDPV